MTRSPVGITNKQLCESLGLSVLGLQHFSLQRVTLRFLIIFAVHTDKELFIWLKVILGSMSFAPIQCPFFMENFDEFKRA